MMHTVQRCCSGNLNLGTVGKAKWVFIITFVSMLQRCRKDLQWCVIWTKKTATNHNSFYNLTMTHSFSVRESQLVDSFLQMLLLPRTPRGTCMATRRSKNLYTGPHKNCEHPAVIGGGHKTVLVMTEGVNNFTLTFWKRFDTRASETSVSWFFAVWY